MKFAIAVLLLCAPLLSGQDYPVPPGKWKYPGLWLKVTDEAAPAGGVAQIQVTLTEPKPIIRTRMYLEFDETVVDEILSVAIFSESGEAMGTAIRTGNLLSVEAASPTGELGNSAEYPVITATVRLKADVAPGTRSAFRILPASAFLDGNGADWVITDNAPGSLTVEGTLSIEDVVPGAGTVLAGQPIRILGTGFRSWSKVDIYEAPAAKVTYVSPTELQVTLAGDFQMDQRRVQVVNPDLTERAFFTHVRGRQAAGSTCDLLTATMPLFSHKTWSLASITLPDTLGANGSFAAIALQNPSPDAVLVRLALGEVSTTVALLSGEKLVRGLDELFSSSTATPGLTLRVEASAPVQMLGLVVQPAGGSVLPLAISNVQTAGQ